MRPALIAAGGREMRQWRGKRGRERGTVSEQKRWNRRMESGVGNQVFGTEKRFSGVRVQVLGGFELNDENNFEKIYFNT